MTIKKINIQKDVDSRREIARMVYPAISVIQIKAEPVIIPTDDKSKEEMRKTPDTACTVQTENSKKKTGRRTAKGDL